MLTSFCWVVLAASHCTGLCYEKVGEVTKKILLLNREKKLLGPGLAKDLE